MPELVRPRNHRRTHGTVLVRALRPRQIGMGVDPQCEAHWEYDASRTCGAEMGVKLPAFWNNGWVFEDREPSIFPHPFSAWWIAVFLAIGYVPSFLLPGKIEGWGRAWAMD